MFLNLLCVWVAHNVIPTHSATPFVDDIRKGLVKQITETLNASYSTGQWNVFYPNVLQIDRVYIIYHIILLLLPCC